jgi:hypothetical protein
LRDEENLERNPDSPNNITAPLESLEIHKNPESPESPESLKSPESFEEQSAGKLN